MAWDLGFRLYGLGLRVLSDSPGSFSNLGGLRDTRYTFHRLRGMIGSEKGVPFRYYSKILLRNSQNLEPNPSQPTKTHQRMSLGQGLSPSRALHGSQCHIRSIKA